MHESDLEQLIKRFGKLPGLGGRSARRIVLHLLKQRESLMQPLADALIKTANSTLTCETCGNLDTASPCHVCMDAKRDESILCVVEDVADLWALERGRIFPGRYHVLGGVLSAIDGIGPDQLNIASLLTRAVHPEVKEIIIATNATVDGQTTAHYLSERLRDAGVKITRLAHGMPIGGEMDYLDEGTLHAALDARKAV